MSTKLFFVISTCLKAQQNAWPENRFENCADAYIVWRKFNRESSLWIRRHDYWIGIPDINYALKIHRNDSVVSDATVEECHLISKVPQVAAALSITNMMNPPFFFAYSPFLLFSSRLPCLVVSLSACSCGRKGIIIIFFSWTVFEQNAWPGNRVVKCVDAYKFWRKCPYIGSG